MTAGRKKIRRSLLHSSRDPPLSNHGTLTGSQRWLDPLMWYVHLLTEDSIEDFQRARVDESATNQMGSNKPAEQDKPANPLCIRG